MTLIIIKGKNRIGRTRSEIERNLTKEWGRGTLSAEQIDKARFIEKHTGLPFPETDAIDKIGGKKGK